MAKLLIFINKTSFDDFATKLILQVLCKQFNLQPLKRIISILFLTLLFMQAIPVLHFFSSQKEIFYSYIDEDKPSETKVKEKKDAKQMDSFLSFDSLAITTFETGFEQIPPCTLPHPYLDCLTEPPDTVC